MRLLSIGEFARLSFLTGRALRWYDELGLLKPAYTDEATGYRFYRSEQIVRANTIRELRFLEVPLEEIKRVLETPALEPGVLHTHMKRLETRRVQLGELTRQLQERLNRRTVMTYEVRLKTVGAETIAFIREYVRLPETGGVLKRAMDEVLTYLEQLNVKCVAAPFCAYPLSDHQGEVVPVDCCVPVDQQMLASSRVQSLTSPETQMAYTIHVGSYESLPGAFHAVQTWVEQNNFEVTGALHEIYLEHDRSGAEHHRVEIAFPVRSSS
jgi:DNA-binding transcriptional MerR regulator